MNVSNVYGFRMLWNVSGSHCCRTLHVFSKLAKEFRSATISRHVFKDETSQACVDMERGPISGLFLKFVGPNSFHNIKLFSF